MNPFTKQNVLLAALALALGPGQPPARAAATDKPAVNFPDPVVATGKGFEIKRSQLDDAFLSYNTSVAANGGSIPEGERSVIQIQFAGTPDHHENLDAKGDGGR